MDLSIVIPVFNEEQSINRLFDEIKLAIDNNYSYEIIFINDGSTDNTVNTISEIILNNKNIKLIDLNKNYGKSIALQEGFNCSSGNIVVTMDGDLQDDPSEINKLISVINDGSDIVSGWKKDRNDPFSKTFPSKFFNYIVSFFSGVKIHDFNCGLKAYKKEVIKSLNLYGGMHRFIPFLASLDGFNTSEIVINHRKRKFGKSKYSSSRLAKGLFDFLTVLFMAKYSKRPMHFFGRLGLFISFFGFFILCYLSIQWLNGQWIGNRPLFYLGIMLVIVGFQFLSLGLVGELLVKYGYSSRDVIKKNFNNSSK